jgi:fibronectin-binding autotransporter adhesin
LENGFFSPTAVTLGSGTNSGVLQVFGQAFISSLTISGTGTANAVIGGGSLVIQSPSSFTFGGTIGSKIANNNALSLAVFTGGVLDLTGVNTYTGGTAIDEGALQIGGGSSIGGTAGTALYLGLQPLNGQLILGDSTGIGNAVVSTITNQSNGTGAANSIVGGNAAYSTLTITGSTGFTGSIGGTGTNNNNLNLVISSTGNFNLSSIATYTGSTTINGGALTISSPATLTNSITVNGGILTIASGGSIAQVSGVNLAASGATFDITNAGNQTIQDLSGVSGTGVLLLGNTLTEGTSNSTTFAGTIQNETVGNGTLIKQGSGTLTLTGSVSALNLSINGGVLNSGASGELSGTNQITFGGGTLQYSAVEGTDYSRRIVNSSGAISIDTNGRNVSFSSSLAASNSGGFTKLGAGTLTLSASNQYTGTTIAAGGTLNLISAGALNSTGNIVFTGGQLLYTTTNTVDYSSRIVNSSSAISLNDGSGQNITYASALAASNSGGLSKFGFGTLTLTGTNLYTGTTTLASGTLNLGSIGALNSTGNITFTMSGFSTGILQYSAANQVDYSSRIVNSHLIQIDTNGQNVTFASALAASNTGGLTKLGAGTLMFAANNVYVGNTSVSAGTLQVGIGGTTGSLGSGNVGVAGTLIYDRSDNISNGNVISGAGTLIQMGTGTLTLTGFNTFTGATGITAGTLAFGSIATNGAAQPLGEGTGAIMLGNGTLQYTGGTNATAFGRSVTVTTGTTGTISNTGGGTMTLTGGTLTKTGSVLKLQSGNFVINDVITSDRVADTSFNSDMAFSSGGTVTLNAQNTYFGPTFIDNTTTVQNGIINALPTDTVLTLGSSSTNGKFDLGGFNQTVMGLTSSGTGTANIITNNASGTGTSILTVNNDTTTSNNNYTFGGNIQDGLTAHVALVKTGDHTLTLSGVNTYSGGTIIQAGTLVINGSINGSITVNHGTEFDGHGSVGGSIGGAGAVGPGNSPGILTAAQVDPSGGLTFNLEFTQAGQPTFSNAAASGNDVLHLTSGTPFLSALTSANAINLYFSSLGTFDGGFFVNGATDDLTSNIATATYTSYILNNASGTFLYNGNKYDLASADGDALSRTTLAVLGANFADGTGNGFEAHFAISTAVAVPEPSTCALMLGGLALLGLVVRRKVTLAPRISSPDKRRLSGA